MLVPEPNNPYDRHAIAVKVNGRVVGYLPRETARQYGQGVRRLMEQSGHHVTLQGVIVGGGHRPDGLGRLGIWLKHDPADFG